MKIIFPQIQPFFLLQNNDDINGNDNNYHPSTPPGRIQSISHTLTIFKSHHNVTSWIILSPFWRFRALSHVHSWEPRLVQLKVMYLRSLHRCQKWCSRGLHTRLRPSSLHVIASFCEFKRLPIMCLHAVENGVELAHFQIIVGHLPINNSHMRNPAGEPSC